MINPPTLDLGEFTIWGAQNGDVLIKFTKSITEPQLVNETQTIRANVWDRFVAELEEFEMDPDA